MLKSQLVFHKHLVFIREILLEMHNIVTVHVLQRNVVTTGWESISLYNEYN